MTTEDLLTAAQVAAELGIPEPDAARLIRTRAPKGSVRVTAGDIRVPRASLDQLRGAKPT